MPLASDIIGTAVVCGLMLVFLAVIIVVFYLRLPRCEKCGTRQPPDESSFGNMTREVCPACGDVVVILKGRK